jgi:hypothetical protein
MLVCCVSVCAFVYVSFHQSIVSVSVSVSVSV